MMRHLVSATSTLTLSLALAGCTTLGEAFDRRAADLGFSRSVVEGNGYAHVVYAKEGTPRCPLHVYLDGDGVPMAVGRATDDPTPRRSLVLRLMAIDPASAIYLGRPCYHGLAGAPGCSSRMWTTGRYGEAVVASMAMALHRLLAARDCYGAVLIGHSGGGVLAMLLAERVTETRAIVTIAANLDVAGWAAAQGLPPLEASLDPALRPPLPPTVRQLHHAGGRDRIVPWSITAKGVIARDAELVVHEDYDHTCCWDRHWPAVLDPLGD